METRVNREGLRLTTAENRQFPVKPDALRTIQSCRKIISDRPRALHIGSHVAQDYLSLIHFIGLADYIAEAFPNELLVPLQSPRHFAAGYRSRKHGAQVGIRTSINRAQIKKLSFSTTILPKL